MPYFRQYTAALLGLVCVCAVVTSAPFAEARAPSGVGVHGAKGLNFRLTKLLIRISGHFGRPVVVSSGCRSGHGNRRAGGAKRSFHLRCMAADVKVVGISEARVLRFARNLPGRGGVGTYCRNSVVHIDVGPRREWHQGCSNRQAKRRTKKRTLVASRN